MPQKIGVYDNTSLIACLVVNYESLFPESPSTDAQDMIQRMAAEILSLRIRLNDQPPNDPEATEPASLDWNEIDRSKDEGKR